MKRGGGRPQVGRYDGKHCRHREKNKGGSDEREKARKKKALAKRMVYTEGPVMNSLTGAPFY